MHSIAPAGDNDWMKFNLGTLSEIVLETTGVQGDTYLSLYNSALELVESNDDGDTDLFSYIDRRCGVDALPAGTYYIMVRAYASSQQISAYTMHYNRIQTCVSQNVAGKQTFLTKPGNDDEGSDKHSPAMAGQGGGFLNVGAYARWTWAGETYVNTSRSLFWPETAELWLPLLIR